MRLPYRGLTDSLETCAGLSRLSRPALTFRTAAVWGRVERKGKPSATAGYRSKKLPGPYDFIDVLTSRLAPLGCICSGLPPVCALALERLPVGQ